MADTDNLIMQLAQADLVCRDAYDHFAQADRIEATTAEVDERYRKKRLKLIGCGFIIYFIFGAVLRLVASLLEHIPAVGHMLSMLVTIVVGLLMIFVIVVTIRGMIMQAKKEAEDEKKQIRQRAAVERNNGKAVLQNNVKKLSFLNPEYWYPVATTYFVRVVREGRARNLPEAIDKFEEQKHRWKLEEAANQMSQMQAEQAAMIESLQAEIYDLQSRVRY